MGETQLHYASSYKGAAKRRNQPNDNSGAVMVEMLLAAGAKANMPTKDGIIPLHLAALQVGGWNIHESNLKFHRD